MVINIIIYNILAVKVWDWRTFFGKEYYLTPVNYLWNFLLFPDNWFF
jgi:hypothetical protein